MKISPIAFRPVAAAILVLGALLGSACASRAGGGAAGDDRAPAGSAFRLASTLSGSYRGVGNDLRLRFDSTGSLLTGTAFNLYLTASGSYGGRSVNEQGILHLESQGRGVRAAFIPHFDAGESPLSPTATQFSAT